MDIEYIENGDVAIAEGHRFRRDKRTGYYLSSAKINGKRRRLHVFVWEHYNGSVPEGYQVHHIDEDKGNNDITNLVLMTSSKHSRHHAIENAIDNYEAVRDNMVNVAGKAAKAWHKSPEGHAWHKEHYKQMEGRLHAEQKHTCAYCGAEFTTTSHKSQYCSNRCKAAARRKSGVDNVEKICEKCGKPYIANKYQQTKYCPVCTNRKR